MASGSWHGWCQVFGKWKKPNHEFCVPNRYVHFHISDVYVPEPAQLLALLHGQDLLEGRIVELSDSGIQAQAFAVVEVAGISQPVVVPVAKIVDFAE